MTTSEETKFQNKLAVAAPKIFSVLLALSITKKIRLSTFEVLAQQKCWEETVSNRAVTPA